MFLGEHKYLDSQEGHRTHAFYSLPLDFSYWTKMLSTSVAAEQRKLAIVNLAFKDTDNSLRE